MKKNKSTRITLWIFIGLVLGILCGLFMPGRYEWALPFILLLLRHPAHQQEVRG